MQKVISLLMENQAGALSRVVGLFSQRGYNIDSLIVAPTSDSTVSRLTMTTHEDEKVVEQITKQVNKLIDVVKVKDLTGNNLIDRELLLIKLEVNTKNKSHLDKTNCSILSEEKSLYVAEFIGTSSEVDKVILSLQNCPLLEVVRTGVSAISSDEQIFSVKN
jgi:acetolactate synthase-1/3 small subunit|tara:strand:+ start:251 stop:736 length:486 start_codon:yes stop_codon:yes gene_type:complete